MGLLLTGKYGNPPEAESGRLSLQDCSVRLGLKPSDFVSVGEPAFFAEKFGTRGRYLVFRVAEEEVKGSPVWKAGYYLLPLDAIDVIAAMDRGRSGARASEAKRLPYDVECSVQPPPEVLRRVQQWVDQSQPLFFKCICERLQLRLDPPWGFRRAWKARLRCPGKCQPPLSTVV